MFIIINGQFHMSKHQFVDLKYAQFIEYQLDVIEAILKISLKNSQKNNQEVSLSWALTKVMISVSI